MSARFEGCVALVTGATSGIGLAIARRLVEEGAKVGLVARDAARLRSLCDELGASVTAISANVAVESEVAAAVEKTVRTFGRLDLVFNVAAGARPGNLVDGSSDDWNTVIDVCLKGVYYGIKHSAKAMIAAGRGGAIVNVSSLNQVVPLPGASSYATAKAGVGMLTQNAAIELASHRIRVNTILPGLTATPSTEFITSAAPILDAYLERIPMRRPAAPEEIAGPALFLASSEAAYITGSHLLVDGGWASTGYPDLSRFLGAGPAPDQ